MSEIHVFEDGVCTTIHDFDSIITSLQYYQRKQARLEQENKKTRKEVINEVSEDLKKRLELLQKKVDLSFFSFVSTQEKDRYDDFTKKHIACCKPYKMDATKGFYIKPAYFGIGHSVTVVCPWCGEEEDITDVEAW